MPRWLNPPNLLTLARLLLAPWIVRDILHGEHGRALLLFVIAALSDGVDGYLARRFGWITAAGAYLDPIADKLLLSGVYLAMASVLTVPWWLVIVIFGRDLYLLAACGVALLFTKMTKFPPSVWGKAATFLQIVTAVAWMTRNAAPYPALDMAARALGWPAAAVTLWSALHYTWRGLRLLRTGCGRSRAELRTPG